ncbi:hypothetical protein [uncultured Methanospirillum sp.]|uniref:hypothetical protein n=1 Tax=uncultured Methanospirillum sp. TaxID=262503 RepID=UPI0029C6D4E5|nr:hypothetical protein [uncultured Methanospirillum sp.]
MNFLGLIQAKKLEPKKGYILPYLLMPREEKNILGRTFALYKFSGSFLLLIISEQKNVGFTPTSHLICELNVLIATIRDICGFKTNNNNYNIKHTKNNPYEHTVTEDK